MKKTKPKLWEDADRISDKIVDLLHEELDAGTRPIPMFAGQMLAMIALLKTAETLRKPASLFAVQVALEACLSDLLSSSLGQGS